MYVVIKLTNMDSFDYLDVAKQISKFKCSLPDKIQIQVNYNFP